MKHNYKILSQKQIYSGKIFSVHVDQIEYDSGVKSVREIAQHPGGAAVVAVFPDDTILMVKQYRYPIEDFLWELPAGKLDPGEEPIKTAMRELKEETGYKADSLKLLLRMHSTPGFCTEILFIYEAVGLVDHQHDQALEEGEQYLSVHRLPLAKVVEMIEQGNITDAKTICGVLTYMRKRGKE